MIGTPLQGTSRGKLGMSVSFIRRGVQVSRIYQPVVANPRTTRQVLSREKLLRASRISRAFREVLPVGYAEYVGGGVTGRNLFVRRAIPVSSGFLTGTSAANVAAVPSLIPLSYGNLPNLSFGALDAETPQRVSVEIKSGEQAVLAEASADFDVAIILVAALASVFTDASPAVGSVAMGTGALVSQGGAFPESLSLSYPAEFQGQQCHLWAFTKLVPKASNGIATGELPYRYPSPASPSVYLGSFAGA